jgi:hypothetical protein
MEKAIPSNQNDIINILLENDENREILVFPLKAHADRIEIGIRNFIGENRKWIALRDLKTYSSQNDNSRIYKYCSAFIDLASEMCLDRNHRALKYLVDIYSLDIIYRGIIHSGLDDHIKSRFVRLMSNMYINKDPYAHLKVPNFTRVWNEVSAVGNRIQFYKGELPGYIKQLKSYIIEYLKATNGVQSIFDKEKNHLTLQVIKLAKLMVSYGFYKTKDELRDISV